MDELFEKSTFSCSRIITELYSTSFALGIKTLDKEFRDSIYGIYGYVRFADEIVDTFYEFDQAALFRKFKEDTYAAIYHGISLNPVIHSFQKVVKDCNIDHDLINAFLYSMEMDLYDIKYDSLKYREYIYGSAEVVGLMCLKVFVKGDQKQYDALKDDAKSLGAAFQKVNFLRDLKSDFEDRGRVYFPGIDFKSFSKDAKNQIESEIQYDFDAALRGIMNLPSGSRKGVYLAYKYYIQLFKKIKATDPATIKEKRIRVPNFIKLIIITKTMLKGCLGVI
ncbi:MAG: phytoene/squalene synthase family protein [Leadbetterella sp.]